MSFPVTLFDEQDEAAPAAEAEQTQEAEARAPEADEKSEPEVLAPEGEPAEEVDEDADPDDDFFKSEEERAADEQKTVPLKRLNKVIAQRNDGRVTIAAQAETITELEGWKKDNEEFVRVARSQYSDKDDAAALLAFDIRFVNAFEKLSKTNPTVATAAQAVLAFIKTGKAGEEKTVSETQKPEATEPSASDKLAERLLAKEARSTIDAALADVKPSFVALVKNVILENASSEDLADLDESVVRRVASKFFKENNFAAADVLIPKKVEADPKEEPKGAPKKRPPTAPVQSGGRAAAGTGAGKGGSEERPAAPKTLAEWRANRDRTLNDLFSQNAE